MKILMGPINIASMPATTVASLNKISGVEARYISTRKHKYLNENKYGIFITYPFECKAFKTHPIQNVFFKFGYNFFYRPYRFLTILRWIMWADVVHWTWDSAFENSADLRWAKYLKKKRFIEWVGSDIRIPEITMQESPWYAKIFNNGYEYSTLESRKNSYRRQQKFNHYGFVPILVPEMQLFLKPGLFAKVFTTQYRIFEAEKTPITFFPKKNNDSILIVHAPSAKMAKGYSYILAIIEELKTKYPVEFRLVHNVSREEVMNSMKECDIFIDQIILGSYAAAAIEAMSYGKPVIAFIMPSVYKKGIPYDCPIVNTNPDTLFEELSKLLISPELRYQIGARSRLYVESFHNADLLSKDLLKIYVS